MSIIQFPWPIGIPASEAVYCASNLACAQAVAGSPATADNIAQVQKLINHR
jgi:hypothetical protein